MFVILTRICDSGDRRISLDLNSIKSIEESSNDARSFTRLYFYDANDPSILVSDLFDDVVKLLNGPVATTEPSKSHLKKPSRDLLKRIYEEGIQRGWSSFRSTVLTEIQNTTIKGTSDVDILRSLSSFVLETKYSLSPLVRSAIESYNDGIDGIPPRG